MGRLFWKILGVVLLSNALVFAATFGVSRLLQDEHPIVKLRLEQAYRLAAKAIAAYNAEGHRGVVRFERRQRSRGHKLFLLDDQQRPLGKRLPPELVEQITDFPTILSPRENRARFRPLYAVSVLGQDNRQYYFVAEFRLGLPHKKGEHRAVFDRRLIFLFLGIVISSAAIAWLFNRPMGTLKQATRRFADGDLDTRMPANMTGRRDAVGDLAREFNHMAEQVDALLSAHTRLLRDVSHELRSPLARMQVALSLIEQRAGDTYARERTRIQAEIERLDTLIGQILTLTRLESGSQPLQRAPCDVVALLDQLMQDVRFEHSGDQRQLHYHGPEQLMLQADAARLHSAFENVLRNAMRYTPDASAVTVTLSVVDDGCEVVVADEGPGVPEEALPRLFDAFYRTQDAREADTGGVGVGLAIAQRIIALHGGRITASNRLSGGLAMRIVLPIPD